MLQLVFFNLAFIFVPAALAWIWWSCRQKYISIKTTDMKIGEAAKTWILFAKNTKFVGHWTVQRLTKKKDFPTSKTNKNHPLNCQRNSYFSGRNKTKYVEFTESGQPKTRHFNLTSIVTGSWTKKKANYTGNMACVSSKMEHSRYEQRTMPGINDYGAEKSLPTYTTVDSVKVLPFIFMEKLAPKSYAWAF